MAKKKKEETAPKAKTVDEAVEAVRNVMHEESRDMSDDDYLDFLDALGSDIELAVEAKRDEMSE